MRNLLLALCCALLLTYASLRAQTSQPTITGPALPGLERFDPAITGLMTLFNSPGAQLAVSYRGRLLIARGYGVADREAGNVPVQPDSLFRIASDSKPLTGLAVLTLVEQGKLSLDTKVFPFLGLTPLPGATNLDPRLQTITVQHLLHHTGGWDLDITPDQTFATTAIAAAAGVPAPADADTIIRYHLGRRLDFDPGTRYAYANIGYVTLGQVIQKASGQPYGAYVQANVLAKAGVTRGTLSRSLLSDRHPDEVRYYEYPGAPLVRSAFPPTTSLVPFPYGGMAMESIAATGGWALSAVDYVRLLCALDGTKPGPAVVLTPATIDLWTSPPPTPVSVGANTYYAMGVQVQNIGAGVGPRATWFHNGSLPGSRAYMVRFANGWTYAITFNTRTANGPTMINDISAAMNPIISSSTPPATGDLFLTSRPEIVASPASQRVSAGGPATLSATFSSVTSPTYQWFKDGTALAGATTARLAVGNASAANAGVYHVTATNLAGNTNSAPATLSVGALSTAGRLTNLSILAALADSDDTFTMGYVVGGSGTSGAKQLVIRAAGPSLGALGVDGTLADPKIELFAGPAKTGENNDWGGDPLLAGAMAGVGAFAYNAPTSKDAAAAAIVRSGDNSVKISGTGAGTVITELYDATPSVVFTPTTPRLVNVSVLKQLGTGLTVGFVVGGTAPVRVLVRAVGPALGAAPFNVPGVVADPQLTLFAGSAKIGENDNWGGTAALTAAFTQVGAFALPATSKDAAVLATLAPGNYSVQVSGIGGTGLALVEVYEVP